MPDAFACFLRNDGEVLLCRRGDDPETGDGPTAESAEWDVPRAPAGDDPEAVATALAERAAGDATLVRSGRAVDAGGESVRPFLFDCADRSVDSAALPGDPAETAWATPTELLRRDAGPGAWRAYEVVAPTVRSVAADDEHGSAYLSVRALEVLRDRAAVVADEGAADDAELRDLAARLRRARPSMAALHNRVNRAVAEADGTPAGVEASADGGIDRAIRADEGAASAAADRVRGEHALTLSRSGTVLAALREGPPAALFVAESRPGNEGVGVAETLADGTSVTLHTDAAAAHVLATADVDAVLVGADTVLPDGSVVNKTGTRAVALAAAREGVPLYAAAASDKVATDEEVPLESGDRAAVYDGDAPVDVRNPTFDVTPPDLVEAVVTERGALSPDDVADVAEELRELAERADE
ncbi:initiation factor 2B [Halostella litorea]|uniref:initiation factor 2B n=1 Tax=Halostella litorea TaxID=2528831 RepID=UPI0010927FFF|nr:initiation factor 2B [Halostella litorea]